MPHHFIDQQGAWDTWGDYWGLLVEDPPAPDDPSTRLPAVPATCELWVDGVRVADTGQSLRDGDPTVLTGLSVSWGRATTVDQPDGSTCSFTIRDPAGGFAFLGTYYTGATVQVWASAVVADPTVRRALVWAGRITNLTASPDLGGGLVIAGTAADVSADLGNRVIGDDPWPVESVGVRFARIVALSGLPITDVLDPGPAGLDVGYQDVDATDVWSLLADLANSTGAVLWPATTTDLGAYLFLEDVGTRPASIRLALVAGVPTIVGVDPDAGDRSATILSACDILAEPITWVTDVSDRITSVDVTWQEQTLDEDGIPAPTERHVLVTDAAAVAAYGVRRLSLSTQLTDSTDAGEIAARLLAQHDAAPWRMQGVRWDTLPTPATTGTVNDLLDLLDGTIRLGRRVVVTDLPNYAPLAGDGPDLAAYLEGGQYTFTGGAWVLELTLSPAAGLGESVAWSQIPTTPGWTWADFPTSITWRSLYGVAGPL